MVNNQTSFDGIKRKRGENLSPEERSYSPFTNSSYPGQQQTESRNPEEQAGGRPPQIKKPSKWGSVALEVFKFALIALLIVVPIRVFVAQPFIVNGASMDPTFSTGQYLIVDQLSSRFETPERGSIIVFRYPNDPSKFFIKRVIGLPGETVEIREGVVGIINKDFPDGFILEEPYVIHTKKENLTVVLEEDEYFVLGDNRAGSSDSRVWGPLDEDLITGRALIRLLPLNQIQLFPGKH